MSMIPQFHTFFVAVFECCIWLEDLATENKNPPKLVFREVVSKFSLRLVPLVEHFVRQLWSTLLTYYSESGKIGKLVELLRFGVDEMKVNSVTSKKSSNGYKSCTKMISLKKLPKMISLQKLTKNVGELGKII